MQTKGPCQTRRSKDQAACQPQLKALGTICKAKGGCIVDDQIGALRIIRAIPINRGAFGVQNRAPDHFTVDEQRRRVDFQFDTCAQDRLANFGLGCDPSTRSLACRHFLGRNDDRDVRLVKLRADSFIANQNGQICARDHQLINRNRGAICQQHLLVFTAFHEHVARGFKRPSNGHSHVPTQTCFVVG